MSNYLNQLFTMATQAHQSKSYKTAENIYRQILREFPDHPDALHLMGLVFSEQGKTESAVRYISKAIEKNPANPVYLCNLGEVYRRSGQLEEALSFFQKSLHLQPDFVEAKFNTANTYRQQGLLQQSAFLYQEILNTHPKHIRSAFNYANLLMESGQYTSAIEAFKKVLELNPNHVEAHNNLGVVLLEWDRFEEALFHYQQALKLQPGFEPAKKNLIDFYEARGLDAEARMYLKTQEAFKKGTASALLHEKSIAPIVPYSNEEIDSYRSEIFKLILSFPSDSFSQKDFQSLIKQDIPSFSNLIYQGRDDKELKIAYAKLFEPVFPTLPAAGANAFPHIGFVVTTGHEGVFLKCMKGILNTISTEKFKVTVVCCFPNGEKIIRPEVKNPEVQFLVLPQDLSMASDAILKSKFDLLHYWEIGTDKLNYFLPFLRLARVQCTSWGWPVTSGIPNVDYFISGGLLDLESSREHYTEKLKIQKRLPVYYYRPPVPDALKPLSEFGLDERKNHYLCQQNLRKVHPDFDVLVKGILEEDKDGVVIFIHDKHATVTDQLKKRLQKTCAQVFDRIHFMNRLSEQGYLSLLAQCPVALDTLHYGGGANTCYDAFATGTPLVTLPGKFHRSRFALAAYTQIDFTSCIASSVEDYIRIAVQLGTDKKHREEISTALKKTSVSIFEDLEAVKELEEVFLNFLNKT